MWQQISEWFFGLPPSTQVTLVASVITAVAALSGAFLAALAAYLLRRSEQRSGQKIALLGILQLLDIETAHNASLLEEFDKDPTTATDLYRSTLRFDVWEETRLTLAQLLPHLKDRGLLPVLAEYYDAMQVMSEFGRSTTHTADVRRDILRSRLPELNTLNDAVRPRLVAELQRLGR